VIYAAYGYGTATVTCPSDMHAIGGGGWSADDSVLLQGSYPSDAQGINFGSSGVGGASSWTVKFVSISSGSLVPASNIQVDGYVICAP
jgi:hypothetical protein